VVATPEETLADERRRRIPAAVAAVAAGILSLLSSILAVASDKGFPSVHVIRALREHLVGPQLPPPGLKARQVLYVDGHALKLLVVALVLSLAAVAIGLALTFLYRAAYARRPQVGRAAVVVTIAGTVLVALPGLVKAIALAIDAHQFAGSSTSAQSAGAARDVLGSPVAVAALFLGQLGRLMLGAAFVLVSLKAMSVGLLTRFMGVLGIIVGVLFILPLGTTLPFVQTFWLIALAALFLARWPGAQGPPPAWVSGEAQPWPTQQELREARLGRQQERGAARGGQSRSWGGGGDSRTWGRGAAATREIEPPAGSSSGGKGRGRPEIPETPAPAAPKRPAHSSSKKKKRRRR
jgi:hypothetical protein